MAEEEEGILSSEDEGEGADKPKKSIAQGSKIARDIEYHQRIKQESFSPQDIDSFAQPDTQQIFGNDKRVEKLEFEYNFNDQEISKFNAKVETKSTREMERLKSQADDTEQNYVAGKLAS